MWGEMWAFIGLRAFFRWLFLFALLGAPVGIFANEIPESIRNEPDLAQLYRVLVIEQRVPQDLLEFFVDYQADIDRFPHSTSDNHPAIEKWSRFWQLPEVKQYVKDQIQSGGRSIIEQRQQNIRRDSRYFQRLNTTPYTSALNDIVWRNHNREGTGTQPIDEAQARARALSDLGLPEDFNPLAYDPSRNPEFFDPNFERSVIQPQVRRQSAQERPASQTASAEQLTPEQWKKMMRKLINDQFLAIAENRKNLILDYLPEDAVIHVDIYDGYNPTGTLDNVSISDLRTASVNRFENHLLDLPDGRRLGLRIELNNGATLNFLEWGQHITGSAPDSLDRRFIENYRDLDSIKREVGSLGTALVMMDSPDNFEEVESILRQNLIELNQRQSEGFTSRIEPKSYRTSSGFGDNLSSNVLNNLNTLLALNLLHQNQTVEEVLAQESNPEETLYLRNTQLDEGEEARFRDRGARAIHDQNQGRPKRRGLAERASQAWRSLRGIPEDLASTQTEDRTPSTKPSQSDPFLQDNHTPNSPDNSPFSNKAVGLFESNGGNNETEFIYRPSIYSLGEDNTSGLSTSHQRSERVIQPLQSTDLDRNWFPLFLHNRRELSSLQLTDSNGQQLVPGVDYETRKNSDGLVTVRALSTPIENVSLSMGFSQSNPPSLPENLSNLNQEVLRSVTADLERSGLTRLAQQINQAMDNANTRGNKFGLKELEKLVKDNSRYSFDNSRTADFSLRSQGPYAHLQPFLDRHGRLHMQCNGAAILQSQLLNDYFSRAELPYSAEYTSVHNLQKGTVTDQDAHAVLAVRHGENGPVLSYLDSTATVFGRMRDYLHHLKTKAKRDLIGATIPEELGNITRQSSDFHANVQAFNEDGEVLMNRVNEAISPLRQTFRDQEKQLRYRPLQDPIRIVSDSHNMNPHLASMRAYRFINFLLDPSPNYSPPLLDMDERNQIGDGQNNTRGIQNIGVMGEIDAHIEILERQLKMHEQFADLNSQRRTIPTGYSVYLRPEVDGNLQNQINTALNTLREVRARPNLIHERAYEDYSPPADNFADSNAHPERYMHPQERERFLTERVQTRDDGRGDRPALTPETATSTTPSASGGGFCDANRQRVGGGN